MKYKEKIIMCNESNFNLRSFTGQMESLKHALISGDLKMGANIHAQKIANTVANSRTGNGWYF